MVEGFSLKSNALALMPGVAKEKKSRADRHYHDSKPFNCQT
jgi:hypothetical protein